MFASSVLIISGLDSQSKFQMFTLFSGRHVGDFGGTRAWRFHTGLCKFVQNISTNIWRSGKRTDLKLGEVSQLSIYYQRIYTPTHNYLPVATSKIYLVSLYLICWVQMLLLIYSPFHISNTHSKHGTHTPWNHFLNKRWELFFTFAKP